MPSGQETWEEHQRKMLAETEQFIEWGLRNPELVNWIPAKPQSERGVGKKAANWFYQTILSGGADKATEFWRRKLRAIRNLREQ